MISNPVNRGKSAAGTVTAVVIGAGHAGLAMSRFLTVRSIDHVILERGKVANSWRHERWDSLRLLTPNWQTRLPGYAYQGDNPDGFMNVHEVINFISTYSQLIEAPVHTGVTVTSVKRFGSVYRVSSNEGDWFCRAVIIATGAFAKPAIPAVSRVIPASITQIAANQYRNPALLPRGNVLVVGGSATGLQLADEIQNSGRQVTLAIGEHVRMPRTYRGRDIQWWMDTIGVLDERYDQIDDLNRARKVPSPQLVGSKQRRPLDINALRQKGVKVAGRLMGCNHGKALFSGSLANVCALADLKFRRLLGRIDCWVSRQGLDGKIPGAERYSGTQVDKTPLLNLDLASSGVRTIIWATGFRPDYSWLDVPVKDRKGNLRHDGGVVEAPGIYVLGLPFLRRRKSSFIHGAEDDARDLSAHLMTYLDSLCNRSGILAPEVAAG